MSEQDPTTTYLGHQRMKLQWSRQREYIEKNKLLSLAQLAECGAAAVSLGGLKLTRPDIVTYFKFTGSGHYTLIDDQGVFARVKNDGNGKWRAEFPNVKGEVTSATPLPKRHEPARATEKA